MEYQFIPYAWVLFASALVSLLIGLYVWRCRTAQGAVPFFILTMASLVWSVANALEFMGTNLPTKIFWANVQYISYNIIPISWIVMTLQHTGTDRWLTRRRFYLLLVIPVLTVILVWTNDWHGLMRSSVFLDTSGSFPVVGKAYGPWFWVNSAYSYPLMFISCVILFQAVLRSRHLYRRQTLALLIGMMLPFIVNLAFIFEISPLKYDVAPTFLSIGGIFCAWGLFRFKLFDILPVAQQMVIESMGDGMIVIDKFSRIVDLNPASQKMIGISGEDIGKTVIDVFKNLPDLMELLSDSSGGVREIAVAGLENTRYYEARCWPLMNRRGNMNGGLLLLHDFTEARQAQQEVLRQQRFTVMLEERERLARELHDSLGQVFGYINVQAQAVRKFMNMNQLEVADDYLQKMIGAAKEAHSEVRGFIRMGLDKVLSEKGLLPAIEDLLKKFGANYGLETDYNDCRDNHFNLGNPVAEAQIFRIIQESLNNIRKHAGADRAWIRVEDSAEGIVITIQDNGRGFELDKVEGINSFGLRIMQERAVAAGSKLSLNSTPGKGTLVRLEIPSSNQKGYSLEAAETGIDLLEKEQVVSEMKVLLVDDHTLFLDGLVSLLRASNIEVVGTARDGLEALRKARELKPDIIVMDIQMPGCDGLTATRLIKAELPQIKIVMLTMAETDDVLFEAIKNGASGYLLKDLDGDEFIELLLDLERGEVPLSPGIATRFLDEFRRIRNENSVTSPESQKINEELTPRQVEVLTMVAGGMTYKEIGASLFLTERGIKYHMGEIIAKLQINDRHQAITLARKAGLIHD